MAYETLGKRHASTSGRAPAQRQPPAPQRPLENRRADNRFASAPGRKQTSINASTGQTSRQKPFAFSAAPPAATPQRGRRGSSQSFNDFRRGIASAKPSVFNNFGKQKPVHKRRPRAFGGNNASVYSPKARSANYPNNGYNSVVDIDPRTIPSKFPQTGRSGIDNPRRLPSTDWSNQSTCQCGGDKGCTTLSRFIKNDFNTMPEHEPQIEELARNILEQNINVVVITGHTDESGPDEYNMGIGVKRSLAVEKKIKQALHRQEEWSPNNVYFKTVTKGETQPVSNANDGLNRRVEVCLRRVELTG